MDILVHHHPSAPTAAATTASSTTMTNMSTATKYPRNINVDFRKLSKEALNKVGEFYGVESLDTLSQEELSIQIAKKFESFQVSEFDTVDRFATQYCRSNAEYSKNRKRQRSTREVLDSEPARVGEQVAAKVSQVNENGSWILGNILSVDEHTYDVQDEDDAARTVTLSHLDVHRLEDSASHLRRGDNVLAVFPETTSFYRATVIKTPKPPPTPGGQWEVIVRFEDDEDDSGKAPARRVPGRFVLRREDVEGDEDDEEDDD